MPTYDVLTDRASLQRAFYRLTATRSNNPAMIAQDASTLETLNQFLQYGCWDAQEFLIDNGLADRWVSASSALTPFLGTDAANGGRYIALPADFIRLAGDPLRPALRYPNGDSWGQLIDFEDRFRAGLNCFWLQSENLWITRGSSPPSTLVMDYHARHATLADGSTVDFPTAFRPLIVAFAADRAMNDAWLPGDSEMMGKISANLTKQQASARRRARRTRAPKKIKMFNSGASHHWK